MFFYSATRGLKVVCSLLYRNRTSMHYSTIGKNVIVFSHKMTECPRLFLQEERMTGMKEQQPCKHHILFCSERSEAKDHASNLISSSEMT
jgi:hypothetical protein